MTTYPLLNEDESISDYFDEVKLHYKSLVDSVARDIGLMHDNRGQIDQAIEYWGMLKHEEEHTLDSLRVQAMLKSPTIDHDQMLPALKEWAATHAVALRDDDYVRFQPYDGERKIRVAYCCCWFDSSTIRGQGIPFIAEHDRFKYSIVGYSLGPCDETITQHFDECFDVGSLSDEEFAQKVREDEIDILMEFTGFSPHHRFGAMGARTAPVQISYLNHTGTSGVDNVDYVIADHTAAPKRIDQYFTEEIYRLPSTFFCFNYEWDDFPEIKTPPYQKNGFITFGCFGSQSKINDGIIKIWADLLHAVPGSKLFLRNMGLSSLNDRRFMERRFARWGIPSSRLRLQPGGAREEIKANYNEVDISLDTWPYCGGNTIAESQWMGVPVVTLKGNRFPAAYGASLLEASGCPELIANSPAEYVEISARLPRILIRSSSIVIISAT